MDSGGSFLFSGFPLVGGGVRCSITNGMQMGVGLWPALAKRQRSEPGHTQPHAHARLRTSAQKGPAPHSLFERLCVVPIGTAKVRAPAASPQMRHQRSLSRNERASLRGRGACLRTGGGGEQNQRTKCVVTKQRVCMGNALPVLARAKRAHWCVNEGRGTGGEGGGARSRRARYFWLQKGKQMGVGSLAEPGHTQQQNHTRTCLPTPNTQRAPAPQKFGLAVVPIGTDTTPKAQAPATSSRMRPAAAIGWRSFACTGAWAA